jgi:spore coat polysaccharide biosynthesis predicted glycosyltransferase SpsG
MRCLALAEEWHDQGGNVVFAMSESTPSVRARIVAEKCAIAEISAAAGTQEDSEELRSYGDRHAATWVVLDGYGFARDYQTEIKRGTACVLCVDDFARQPEYIADIVLNSNYGAKEQQYSSSLGQGKILAGLRYALLRREFKRLSNWQREVSRDPLVTVSIGGSDPTGLACKIAGFGNIAGRPTSVVIGGSGRGCPNIEQAGLVEVLRDTRDMTEVLSRSGIAVICAGGTLWECLYMQCATLSYARNHIQQAILEKLQQQNAVRYLSQIDAFDYSELRATVEALASAVSERAQMGQNGRSLVDGHGAERVVAAMLATSSA